MPCPQLQFPKTANFAGGIKLDEKVHFCARVQCVCVEVCVSVRAVVVSVSVHFVYEFAVLSVMGPFPVSVSGFVAVSTYKLRQQSHVRRLRQQPGKCERGLHDDNFDI